ncbi:MAG: tRNA epoxyqueuosine(34) reductase QueG, partial [Betaproteobacteria bacterium]|nr:tRNA epoxyqueuosine(34) reductase QueG [Betaproteobacteria bacterium]
MVTEHAPPAPARGFDGARLLRDIREHARALGLSQIAVSDLQLGDTEAHLARWLEQGMHGTMDYM